jgi:hypothetical protein
MTIILYVTVPSKGAHYPFQHVVSKLYFLTLLHMLSSESHQVLPQNGTTTIGAICPSLDLENGTLHTLRFHTPDTSGTYDLGRGVASFDELDAGVSEEEGGSKKRWSDTSLVFARNVSPASYGG